MAEFVVALISALSVKAVVFIAFTAYSYSQQAKAKRKARDQYNASQVDRLVNMATTIAPRELVLGRVRKGGHVFFRGSVGQYKEKFVMLVSLAAHEIDAVEQVYLNEAAVTLDGNGYVQTEPYVLTRTVTTSVTGSTAPPEAIPGTIYTYEASPGTDETVYQYLVTTSKARIRAYLGAPGQTADAQVVADFPTLWTSAHTASGVAYLVCEFWYDETAFPSSLPTVTAVVRGARVYDPRSATTAWTENPALHARHVMLHPQFGKRSSFTADEEARIAAAANACDTSHNYGAGAVALYRSSIVIPFGSSARDALDDLAQAMAGQWAFAGGEFFVRAGTYTAPVLALTDAHLAVMQADAAGGASQQPISISTHRARNDKFNVVTPRIWDAGQGYKQTALTPLKATALITRDGAELANDVDMPAVFNAPQALHIAGVMLRDARDPLSVTLPFRLYAYRVQLFDTVSLTIARFGWSAKEFLVMARQWTGDGAIQLQLKETAAAHYQPDASFAAQGYAINTALPRPWDITPPTLYAITSGTSELVAQADGTIVTRVRVQWIPVADVSVGSVEVQWHPLGATAWQSIAVPASETQAFLLGAQDGQSLLIRARSRNAVAVSDWCLQQLHVVVGKTEPPAPFDVFLVLAQPDGTRQFNFGYTTTERPVDWRGAQIRYTSGIVGSPVWDDMTPLQDGASFYTASPIEANAPLAGEWTFACRSQDTSGNLSTALVDSITLSARRTGNVYDEFFEHTDGWLGTLSSFQNLAGVLEATDTATWATLAGTWDGWTRWNTTPAASASYTTPNRDLGTVITGQIDAVIDADGTGTLELATSADGTTWSSWGSAAAAFTARWVRLRLTVAASGPDPVPAVREFSWNVSAELKREYLNDVVISGLTGSYRIGTGDIRVPIQNTYAVIKRIGVTVQDSSAGAWTWQRIDNTLTYGPRVQFKLDGTLADPSFVDFDIEGI